MEIKTNLLKGIDLNSTNNPILRKVLAELESNFRNDKFSVEDLASKIGLSRSNLHRKLKSACGLSANQFIREYRLMRAVQLLKKGEMSISEIAYGVGFGSPSYFTTCFTDQFGFPPGEAKIKLFDIPLENKSIDQHSNEIAKNKKRNNTFVYAGISFVILVSGFFIYQKIVAVSTKKDVLDQFGTKSIAVLPFKNLSLNHENDYYIEGVMEAINRHLSQIGTLKVISLPSTNRFRESTKSAKEIAGELSVSTLLNGSIQRSENNLRIEVQLIDAKSERQIWAENFDREPKEIFKTQSEIAEKVAIALKANLSAKEKAVLKKPMTNNTKAYDLYLKGNYVQNFLSRSSNNQALEYFRKAIEEDSTFALAYSGIGMCYIGKAAIFSAELGVHEAMDSAKPYLEKAMELDPELIDPHIHYGTYLLYNNWDFKGAESEYKNSIVTNNSIALGLYADLLNFTNRHNEALSVSRKLDLTNPFFPHQRMILSLYYMKHFDEATEYGKSHLKLHSDYFILDSYGFLMLNTTHYKEAIQLFQQAIDLGGYRYPRMLGWMGAAYARSGQAQKAMELIQELKAKGQASKAGSINFFMGVIYAALGDKKSALYSLNDAYNQHEMEIPWLISEPQFYSLHEEPQFQDLVKRVGFPQ